MGTMATENSLNDEVEFEFRLREVEKYIEASSMCRDLEEKLKERTQFLYDNISPPIVRVTEEGFLGFGYAPSVEDYAIYMIEEKDAIKRQIEKFKSKADIYEKILISLSDLEQKVMNAIYYNQGETYSALGVNREQLIAIQEQSILKIYDVLKEIKEKRLVEEEQARKAELQEKVRDYLGFKGGDPDE